MARSSQVSAKRVRRTTEEVRGLLLSAAQDVFAEQGFAGASTRAIARAAGVSEALLFRNFGSKERLFEAAVTEPLERFLDEYTTQWLSTSLDQSNPDALLREFTEGVFRLARRHRKLLRAASAEQLGEGARETLGRLEELGRNAGERHGLTFDAAIVARAAVAMVMTVAIFEVPLFGSEAVPSDERVIEELSALLLSGIARRDSERSRATPTPRHKEPHERDRPAA